MASAGLQLAGQYGQARSAKLEGQIKSIRYQTQAEAGRVRAEQVGATYSENLETALANIVGITASQNRGVDSATSRALLDKAETVNDRLRLAAMSNERMKAIASESDAAAAKRAGDAAMNAAYLGMAGSAAKFGQGLSDTWKSDFWKKFSS